MHASKLIISQETREKLNNPVLSPMKKRELREQMVVESIRKSVGGVRTKQELIVAAGYSADATTGNYATGFALVNSMIKKGIIVHNPTNAFKKTWTVIGDVKVTPTPKQVATSVVVPQEPMVEPQEAKVMTSIELQAMAKEFAWQHNSDSLREFVAYARNAIK